MALRPNILTDAALHIAFEASILLQYTDINLYSLNSNCHHPEYPSIIEGSQSFVYYKQVNKGFARIPYIIVQFYSNKEMISRNQKY